MRRTDDRLGARSCRRRSVRLVGGISSTVTRPPNACRRGGRSEILEVFHLRTEPRLEVAASFAATPAGLALQSQTAVWGALGSSVLHENFRKLGVQLPCSRNPIEGTLN